MNQRGSSCCTRERTTHAPLRQRGAMFVCGAVRVFMRTCWDEDGGAAGGGEAGVWWMLSSEPSHHHHLISSILPQLIHESTWPRSSSPCSTSEPRNQTHTQVNKHTRARCFWFTRWKKWSWAHCEPHTHTHTLTHCRVSTKTKATGKNPLCNQRNDCGCD